MEAMSKIHIPTPLRQYVGKQATVEVKGAVAVFMGIRITRRRASLPAFRV